MLTSTVEMIRKEFSNENEIDGKRRKIILSFPIIRIMAEKADTSRKRTINVYPLSVARKAEKI
ncbi:hypothetical protein QNN00_25620 [Bacillus velezensis]|nr:hypothetical protein [Bacillus velezensis]